MKKKPNATTSTPLPSCKKTVFLTEDSFKTIQKQPNHKTTVSESTEKDEFKDDREPFALLTLRNDHQLSKDSQNICEFQTEIEKRFKKSVMNKLYSFPKIQYLEDLSEDSSCDSLKNIEIYELASQNYSHLQESNMKKSAYFRDVSNSMERNQLFEKEIDKLNKEIAYYKKHQFKHLPKEMQGLDQLKIRCDSPKRIQRSLEKPHYIKLLSLLEENNSFDIRASINANKMRTPSNSKSCQRKRDLSNKTPTIIKTEKTPCSFDKKIAKTFENCCDNEENNNYFDDIERIENSGYRSISRGKSKSKEISRSISKSKRNINDNKVLSPISLTYMNNYLFDKDFKQERIKKIYSNSIIKAKGDDSKERKNYFEDGEKIQRIDSKSHSKPKKPLKKLYLIHEKENIHHKTKQTTKMKPLEKKTIKNLKK